MTKIYTSNNKTASIKMFVNVIIAGFDFEGSILYYRTQ